jgi:hypothetical protein
MRTLTLLFFLALSCVLQGCSKQHTEPAAVAFEPELLDALGKLGLDREILVQPKVPYPLSQQARLGLVDMAMTDPPSMVGLSRQLLDEKPGAARGAYTGRLLELLGLDITLPGELAFTAKPMDAVRTQLHKSDSIPETDPPNSWSAEDDSAMSLRVLMYEAALAGRAWKQAGGSPSGEDLLPIQEHIATTLTSYGKDLAPHRLLLDNFHRTGARQNLDTLASGLVRAIAAVEHSLPALQLAAPDSIAGEWLTPMGKIKVAGTGDDTHTGDFLLLIDLGGNDTYHNVAQKIEPGNVSIIIDLAGNDTIQWDGARGPGAGLLGVSLWIDMAGDDHYRGDNMGLGVGLLGAGLLWDAQGNDIYSSRTLAQGVGQYGIGILFDDSGNDLYRSTLNAQGYGGPGGIGMLVDHEGNDSYSCDGVFPDPVEQRAARHRSIHYLNLCQGYGFGLRPKISGGIGLLLDHKGNDSYISDIMGQGAAYWFGLGMLVEGAGNDNYEAFEHGQGEGLHLAAGLLADWGGNDTYKGAEHVQGVGMDRSAGILYEFAGNDSYQSKLESQGAGLKSLGVGLLVDEIGDDTYRAMKDAQGYAGNPGEGFPPEEKATGILLDLGGSDRFDMPYAEGVNSNGRIQNRQGIAIDYGKQP